MINHTLQYAVDAVIGLLITGALSQITRALNEFRTIKECIVALLHNQFYRTCEIYIERGCLKTHELVDLDKLYVRYKALGLDGAGDELYKRCKNLEIKN